MKSLRTHPKKMRGFDRDILIMGCVFTVLFLLLIATAIVGIIKSNRYVAAGSPIPAGLQPHGSFDVEAVYMHLPGSYSVAYKDGAAVKILSLSRPWAYPAADEMSTTQVTLLEDALPGSPIRVDFTNLVFQPDASNPRINTFYKVHLHNIKELAGAGWSRGKFGRGTTVAIDN